MRVVALRDAIGDGPPSAEATATTGAVAARTATTTPAELDESTLDGATLTVDLDGVTNAQSLGAARFTLNAMPPISGLTIESVVRTNATRTVLTLAHDGIDLAEDAALGVTVAAAGPRSRRLRSRRA